MSQTPSRVIVISSQVAEGAVGNRVSVLALQRLGHKVTSVPSVFLTWHPGHNAAYGKAQRICPSELEFTAILSNIKNAPWFETVGGILTGYLGNAEQIAPICDLVTALKTKNPNALFICDPVIGEQNGLYVSSQIATGIRDNLVPLADWITPNRFELAWLAGRNVESNEDIIAAARYLPCRNTLVTSAFNDRKNHIANLAISGDAIFEASHKTYDHPPHGTGDLMAAVFSGALLSGNIVSQALRIASTHVLATVADADRSKAKDLRLSSPEPKIGNLIVATKLTRG